MTTQEEHDLNNVLLIQAILEWLDEQDQSNKEQR